MRTPENPEAIVFVDGQNLYKAAREAFGYTYPNYNVLKIAQEICSQEGWKLKQVRFYTGMPGPEEKSIWNQFWTAKLLGMSRAGVYTFTRPLRYRTRVVTLPDGTQHSILTKEEKGIDVRIALDVTRLGHAKDYDVGVILSQDQDFHEVAKEIRTIAKAQERWIKLASAFPQSPASRNRRGINDTDWIPISKSMYEKCIDPRDYRRTDPSGGPTT